MHAGDRGSIPNRDRPKVLLIVENCSDITTATDKRSATCLSVKGPRR